MKKERSIPLFNWSRNPSKENIHSVYIASPSSYAKYGKDITREEMANALSTWNKINDLRAKKAMFKMLFIITLASIPFLAIIHNVINVLLRGQIK